MMRRVTGRTGLVLFGFWTVGCGGSASSPNPVPTPTPTPVVQATPTPTPNPGSVGQFACRLPASSNPGTGISPCPVLQIRLGDQVNAAIDKTQREHPELFDFNDLSGSSPRVKDRDKYHQEVALNLAQAGVCTLIEKEEIAVKTTNEFNEQWNIYASSGYVRRKYVTTCSPAWF